MQDRFSYWDKAQELIPWQYEDNFAFDRLRSEAAQAGRDGKLATDEFRDGVYHLFDAYSDFLCAMNPFETDSKDHRHWHNHFRDAQLGKKLGQPPIDQGMLSSAAYKYLKGPLRVPMLDRALLDAFIAQETFAYIDRSAGRGAFQFHFGCVGILVAGSILYSSIFSTVDRDRLWWGLGGVGALMLVIWAWPKRGPYALHIAMREAYQVLTGSVVPLPELRQRVNAARDKGVVWPPELFAVLDDVESRTKLV